MSHDTRNEVESYIKHKSEVENRIVKDLLKVFKIEDMLDAVVWKLMCNAIDKGIEKEKRREYIYCNVDRFIKKWD